MSNKRKPMGEVVRVGRKSEPVIIGPDPDDTSSILPGEPVPEGQEGPPPINPPCRNCHDVGTEFRGFPHGIVACAHCPTGLNLIRQGYRACCEHLIDRDDPNIAPIGANSATNPEQKGLVDG